MKIIVYAIAKNERQHVARFCESAKDADAIVVADTGSDDGTPDLLRAHGATVHDIRIRPWRFDDARNAALALLPDADICVSLDLDEVLTPGWREEIERVWTSGTTRLRYRYDWGHGVVFSAEKIHARYGYRWKHPCHEYPAATNVDGIVATSKLLIQHLPDGDKSRGQYLDLLRLGATEYPACPRNAFYYTRELAFYHRWDEAIAEGERYLALPKATWSLERAAVMRLIGRAEAAKGNKTQGLNWLRRACAEAPFAREPWCDVAEEAYLQSRWAECYGAAGTALAIQHRVDSHLADPLAWGAKPHDLAAVAAWNLGLLDAARRHAKDAIALDPHDLRLRKNLELIEAKVAA